MKNKLARMIVVAVASVSLVSAQGISTMATAVADESPKADASAGGAQAVIDAMTAIGTAIAGTDQKAEAETPAANNATAAADAKTGDPASVKAPRSARQSVILITGGAAAGAAIGGALAKDSKAAMIGAAVGGAVALIYDRATHKNPGKI